MRRRPELREPAPRQEFCLSSANRRFRGGGRRNTRPCDHRTGSPFFASRRRRLRGRRSISSAAGPRQRSDRIQRRFEDGRSGDIYEAVLAAIAATGPRTQLPYDELRSSLRNVLAKEPPQRHEVTRVLDELTKIAKTKIEGEPVIEFDAEYDTIHISDPFFAFFLRWSTPAGAGDPVTEA